MRTRSTKKVIVKKGAGRTPASATDSATEIPSVAAEPSTTDEKPISPSKSGEEITFEAKLEPGTKLESTGGSTEDSQKVDLATGIEEEKSSAVSIVSEGDVVQVDEKSSGQDGTGHVEEAATQMQQDDNDDAAKSLKEVVETAEVQEVQDIERDVGDKEMEDEGGEEEQNEEEEESGKGAEVAGADPTEEYPDVQEVMSLSERQTRKRLEVFVGGLDKDATEEDIMKVFKEVGEVTEIRLMKNSQTGKNKGYAFVRYANLDAAKRAATELSRVKVRDKTCGVLPSEENNTLFLGNINKTWKKDAVSEKLTGYGIENIEELTLMEDPQKEGLNRGFLFLYFATHKDALTALKRLQKPDAVFGTDKSAKVAWAQPLNEPDEETMAQVKSVFADGMPPSWGEDRVKEYFGKYGDIERVVLARNMSSAKRKDFGFIKFSTREAALACIEAVNNIEVTDGNINMKLKVTLAKPPAKGKSVKGGIRGGYPVSHSGGRTTGMGVKTIEGGRSKGVGRDNKILQHVTSQGVSGKHTHAVTSSQQQLLQIVREQAAAKARQRERISLAARRFPGIGVTGTGRIGGVTGTGRIGGSGMHVHNALTVPVDPLRHHDVVSGYRAAIRQYGGAVPGEKRAYSALEDDRRYIDRSLRHPRARFEPPESVKVGIGGSPYAAESLYGERAKAGNLAQPGVRGGPGSLVGRPVQQSFVRPPPLHSSLALARSLHHLASNGRGRAYPVSGAELRREDLHPSPYGAPSGSGGYSVSGIGRGPYY